MDGDRIEGHVRCAGGQTDQTALVTLKVDQREDVGGTEEQGNDGSKQRAARHISQLALGRALEHGGGAHQGADEQDREPGRDKHVVQNQRQRGWLSETNNALRIFFIVNRCISVDDHQGQDAGIRHQQRQVDLVQLFVRNKDIKNRDRERKGLTKDKHEHAINTCA